MGEFMKVIVLGEKHGIRLVKYDIENLRAIIKERLDEGWYSDGEYYFTKTTFEEAAKELVVANQPAAQFLSRLIRFLQSRNEYEYERFDFQEVEDLAA